jgi:Triose-phosphate Transporter family
MSFRVLNRMHLVSHAVANTVKPSAVLVFAVILFNYEMRPLAQLGVCVTAISVFLYTKAIKSARYPSIYIPLLVVVILVLEYTASIDEAALDYAYMLSSALLLQPIAHSGSDKHSDEHTCNEQLLQKCYPLFMYSSGHDSTTGSGSSSSGAVQHELLRVGSKTYVHCSING